MGVVIGNALIEFSSTFGEAVFSSQSWIYVLGRVARLRVLCFTCPSNFFVEIIIHMSDAVDRTNKKRNFKVQR